MATVTAIRLPVTAPVVVVANSATLAAILILVAHATAP
jgi:hypothetical protein